MNSDKTYPEYTHAHKYNSTGITEMNKKKEQQKLCENSKNPSMAKKQREQIKKDQQIWEKEWHNSKKKNQPSHFRLRLCGFNFSFPWGNLCYTVWHRRNDVEYSVRWANGELCYINSSVFERQINYWDCSHKYLCDYIHLLHHSAAHTHSWTNRWTKWLPEMLAENIAETPFHLAGVRFLNLHRFLAIIHC